MMCRTMNSLAMFFVVCILYTTSYAASTSELMSRFAPAPGGGDVAPSYIRVLVVSNIEAMMSSQIEGRIISRSPQVGESFHKGDLLVGFDCTVYQAERDRANAELLAARKTLAAHMKLKKLDSISDLDIDMDQANLQKMEAEEKITAWRVDQCSLKAPFEGRVIKWHVRAYESVKANDPMVEIVSDNDLELQVFVPSQSLPKIKVGTPFEFTLDETKETYQAEVTTSGAKVDAASQTIELRARITSDHPGIIAGMSGTVSVDSLQ